MSDAETSQQHGRPAAHTATDTGPGRHRGSAAPSEEGRGQSTGPGRHRRQGGDRP